MKSFTKATLITLIALLAITALLQVPVVARTADQTLIVMKMIKDGVQTQGAGTLQVAQLNSISAMVASATRTEVVAAPTAGSTYIAGILVEKSAGATGVVTLSVGTGTNCGTGTAVVLGPITNPVVTYIPLGLSAGSAKAVCLTTEGTSTGARVLYQ